MTEAESPGLEMLMMRLCRLLPRLPYADLRDILLSLTRLHAVCSPQLATLDTLLDLQLAAKMEDKLASDPNQVSGSCYEL